MFYSFKNVTDNAVIIFPPILSCLRSILVFKHLHNEIYGFWEFDICTLETPGMLLSLTTLNPVIRPVLIFVQKAVELVSLCLEGVGLLAEGVMHYKNY